MRGVTIPPARWYMASLAAGLGAYPSAARSAAGVSSASTPPSGCSGSLRLPPRSDSPRPCSRGGRSSSAGHCDPELLLGDVGVVLADDSPLVDHENAIGECADLVEL